jgi:hypothetical protein
MCLAASSAPVAVKRRAMNQSTELKKTAKPLALKSSPSEVEITIAKLERYKSLGSEQILT